MCCVTYQHKRLPNKFCSYIHQTFQVPKMEVLTYISCMDTAYARENPSRKIAINKAQETLHFRYLKFLGDICAHFLFEFSLDAIQVRSLHDQRHRLSARCGGTTKSGTALEINGWNTITEVFFQAGLVKNNRKFPEYIPEN